MLLCIVFVSIFCFIFTLTDWLSTKTIDGGKRGCLFCHRFAENLVTTHFPICPFYVAYISYAVCQGPGPQIREQMSGTEIS